MTPIEQQTEQRAYDATMRIFGRYGCDPRKKTATPEVIAKVMDRMTVKELECVATAQRLIMRMNGVQPHMRLS